MFAHTPAFILLAGQNTDEGPKSIAGDFFAIPVKPRLGHARINWLDADGARAAAGSRCSRRRIRDRLRAAHRGAESTTSIQG